MTKIRKITFDEWIQVFANSESSNYFQCPDWLNLQSEIFNTKNLFYEYKTSKGERYISLQKKGNKYYSSFIGYGGFLAKNCSVDKIQFLNEFLQEIKGKENIIPERVKLFPLVNYMGDKNDYEIDHTAILDIKKDLETQRNLMDKKTRNLVKRSQDHGVVIKPILPDDIEEFYKFYKCTMKRVGSSYLTPIKLFKAFTRIPNVRFLGAYKNEKLVAGSVFLMCNDVTYYWWNSSRVEGRKLDANYALIYEAIKFDIDNNFKYLDMASSHSESIETPKLKWGAKKYPLYIFPNHSTAR